MSNEIIIHTNLGDIYATLYPESSPITVENFLNYIKSNFYQDTIFHRTIKNFMIQGGGLTNDMQEKMTEMPITNEADNAPSNAIGTLAMARTSDPHSATSQFFINVANNSFLDFTKKSEDGWGYCVFGKVTKGLEVVMEISKTPTTTRYGYQDVPTDPITIINIELIA